MDYYAAKANVERGLDTLRAKGFDKVSASLTSHLPGEEFSGVFYYRAPGNAPEETLYYSLGSLKSQADLHERLEAILSVSQRKTKQVLEAIEMIREEAEALGVEMPEGWVNPLVELGDKLRRNILEAPKEEGKPKSEG